MKKRSLTALLCLLSIPAFAASPSASQRPTREGDEPGRRERMESRRRLMEKLRLAEALDLDVAEADRLVEKMRSFEDRRRPLREEMFQSAKVLRQAARGEPAALAQVDQAIERILDNRTKLAALDKEAFTAVARELPPEKRALLALHMAKRKFHKGSGKGKGRFGRDRQRLEH